MVIIAVSSYGNIRHLMTEQPAPFKLRFNSDSGHRARIRISYLFSSSLIIMVISAVSLYGNIRHLMTEQPAPFKVRFSSVLGHRAKVQRFASIFPTIIVIVIVIVFLYRNTRHSLEWCGFCYLTQTFVYDCVAPVYEVRKEWHSPTHASFIILN